MRLGISSYTYGWAVGVPGHEPFGTLDELGLLNQAIHHGVNLIQVCDNLPLVKMPKDRVARFAYRAAQAAVQIEVGSNTLTLEHAHEMISLARSVDAQLLRFVIDGPGFRPSPGEVVRTLTELAPGLDGMTLGIENHDRFPARTLRHIIEAVGSDHIGICLDTANSLGAGEGLKEVVAELGELTVNLHIKDFQIARVLHLMGFTVEGRPAGEGMLDIPWLLEEVGKSRRCKTAILELWTPPATSMDLTLIREQEWATRSLDYLKPLFASPQ